MLLRNHLGDGTRVYGERLEELWAVPLTIGAAL